MADEFKDVESLKISDDLKKKLQKNQENSPENKSLEMLYDIGDMLQALLETMDDNHSDLKKFQKEAGAVLVDMREALDTLKSKESPEMPDFASPLDKAVSRLEKAFKVEVKAPEVNVNAPKAPDVNIDLDSVNKGLKAIPRALEVAILKIPKVEIPETDLSPLDERMSSMLDWLESIDTGVRLKPQAPKEYATNNSNEMITDQTPLTMRVAVNSGDSNLTYIGSASVGGLASAEVWRIKLIDETSGTIMTWADGNSNFDNEWDERENLSYS